MEASEPGGARTSLDETAEDALALDSLPDILLGHTVQGVITSADLMAAPSTSLTTLAGTTLTIAYDSEHDNIQVTPAVPGGSAYVVTRNVGAANGIVHVINAVISE